MTQPQPAAQSSTGANPATVQALSQPAYLQNVAGYNPSFGSYNPANFYGARGYHPASTNNLSQGLFNSLSPGATEQQLQQSMVPQTQQAYQNLNQQLADFGVQGGQAIQAGDQLSGQLTSSLAPAMASAIQNAQGNQLGAGEFMAGTGNQMELANIANKMGQSQFNAGQHNQMGLANAAEGLNASLANAGMANQAGQFNANNANAANQYNVGEQNANQQNLLNAILGNYGQQMGDIYGMNQGLQSGLTNQGLQFGGQVTENPGLFSEMMGGITGLAGAAAPFFNPFGGGFGGGQSYTGVNGVYP